MPKLTPNSRLRRARRTLWRVAFGVGIWLGLVALVGATGLPALSAQGPAGVAPAAAGAEPEELPDDVMKLGNEYVLFYRVDHKPAEVCKKYLAQWIPAGRMQVFGAQSIGEVLPSPRPRRLQRARIAQPNDLLIIRSRDRAQLRTARELLTLIDVPRAQVLIDARVLVVDHTRAFEFGFDFNLDRTGITRSFLQGFDLNFSPSAYLKALPEDTVDGSGNVTRYNSPPFQGLSFNFAGMGQSLARFGISNLAIRALARRGQVEILANPKLLLEEGARGHIHSGETIFIQRVTEPNPNVTNVTYIEKPIGVTLDLFPLMIGDQQLRLRLSAKVEQVTGFAPSGAIGVSNPIIASRKVDTLATIADGKTLVIGGLIQDTHSVNTTTIPILGDIPVLGELFKTHNRSTERREIIFLLTPRILPAHSGTPASTSAPEEASAAPVNPGK